MDKMTTRAMIVALVLAGGCGSLTAPTMQSSGPRAQDQEAALEMVWEGVYGMSIETRPTITWWVACPGGHDNEGCYDEFSTRGNENIIWVGTNPITGVEVSGRLISDTSFSQALEAEREWDSYPLGELAPIAEAERFTKQAQDTLRSSGL